ncbi:MAG: hypothetical protein ACNA8W_10410, partial [Bradymonadaceae bacterium]
MNRPEALRATGGVAHVFAISLSLFVGLCLILSMSCGGEKTSDACLDVICAAGVCDPSSGRCVDAVFCKSDEECLGERVCVEGACTADAGPVVALGCTPETETRDCPPDEYCYEEGCRSAAYICADMTCARGICNAAERTCVSAENCDGDDRACLDGEYCDTEDTCRANLCDLESGLCDRGICEPGTGECVNAGACQALVDCLDAHYCIDGRCHGESNACLPCSGNQMCSYDEEGLSVHCGESPRGCRNGYDCLGDRVCRGGLCAEPQECAPDAFEPNDDESLATNLGDHPDGLQASICRNDVDYYAFDTALLGLIRGLLVVDVRAAREDVGNGQFLVLHNIFHQSPEGQSCKFWRRLFCFAKGQRGFAQVDRP